MKFGQLIEYSMKNFFFEKSYTKCGGETNTTFLKHQNFWVSKSKYLWANRTMTLTSHLFLNKKFAIASYI